jgi:DNA primase
MNSSDEIKSRLDIVDVIREYIQLKAGGSNFQALCPFHREKTPSFMVSAEKQIWHCFGCNRGGDVISFVMEIEGVSFIEALRMLAPKAGVTLKRQNSQVTSQRNRLLDIMEAATNFYYQKLEQAPEAKPAGDYLRQRGLTQDTIADWHLGYSPDSWDDIINLLKQKGYTDREIFQAGLSVKKEGVERYYNRFRARIMFPIRDFNGNTVAFSARVRPDREETEKMGKYINSPQTMIYDKSKILFGLDKAKMAIRSNDFAIVVEGQMDVITAHQHDFKNVVASSGTALTEEQLQKLKRYTKNVYLAFDMDEAGRMAAGRGIQEAIKVDLNIKVVILPAGKDPDELIKNDPEAFRQAIAKARHIMEYYFETQLQDLDLSGVEGKREAAGRLLPLIAKIKNNIEKDEWIRRLAEKLNTDERLLRESLPREKRRGEEQSRSQENDGRGGGSMWSRRSREEMLSEMLLSLLVKFPMFLEYAINRLAVEEVFGAENKKFYKTLILYYNSNNITDTGKELDYQELKTIITSNSVSSSGNNNNASDQLKLLDKLVILGDKEFYDLDPEKVKKEVVNIIKSLKTAFIHHRKKEIEGLIAESERKGESDRVEELMKELKALSDEELL